MVTLPLPLPGPGVSQRLPTDSSGRRAVVSFMTHHLGCPIPSPAIMEKIATAFRRAVRGFADTNRPVVRCHTGERKIDLMGRYLTRAGSSAGEPTSPAASADRSGRPPIRLGRFKKALTGSTGVRGSRSRTGDRWRAGGRCHTPTQHGVVPGAPGRGPPERHQSTARGGARCVRTCRPTSAPDCALALARARAATNR